MTITEQYLKLKIEEIEKKIKTLEQEHSIDDMEREYKKAKALFSKVVECEDTISRKAVIDTLHDYECMHIFELSEIIPKIKQLPSVQPCEDCQHNDGECCRLLFEEKMEEDTVNQFRDATSEEYNYVNNYIKSISKPTGVKFDSNECVDAVDRSEYFNIEPMKFESEDKE